MADPPNNAQLPLPPWPLCRRGSVTVLMALATSMLVLAGLLAIDVAKVALAQEELQSAVDAAVLAAARDTASSTLREDAQKIFDANLRPGYLGSAVQSFDVTLASDETGLQKLDLDVVLKVPSAVLAFGNALNIGWKELTAHGAAERRVRSTELVMVLDNTGSLAGQPIKDLRTAARSLSDALFGGKETVPGLYVGVVPYVASVNIGTQHANWIENLAARPVAPKAWGDYLPTTWKGCVMAQSSTQDSDDDPIATNGMLSPFFWPSSTDNTWPQSGTVSQIPQTNLAFGPNLGCGPPITPLTAAHSVVDRAVDDLDAWNRGGTMANLGLVWGWRALSPRWRGLWFDKNGIPVSSAHPLAYDTPYNSKVIVLMTDGQNGWYQDDLTAYGRPSANSMGTTKANATTDINNRMMSACTALKSLGVIVFTVTFGSVDQPTRDRYTACASSGTQNPLFPGQKYFHAPSGSDLKSAFGNIAGQLTELRLVR